MGFRVQLSDVGLGASGLDSLHGQFRSSSARLLSGYHKTIRSQDFLGVYVFFFLGVYTGFGGLEGS